MYMEYVLYVYANKEEEENTKQESQDWSLCDLYWRDVGWRNLKEMFVNSQIIIRVISVKSRAFVEK